jgi:YVTN family beta-propeller protein
MAMEGRRPLSADRSPRTASHGRPGSGPLRFRLHPSSLILILALPCLLLAQWVEDSVYVGGAWVGGMVYSAEYDVVYGLSNSEGFVFAISCSTSEVLAKIDAYYAGGLAYSPTSRKLYCSFGLAGDSVLIVNGATHRRLRAIPLSGANLIVWDSVGDYVYVSRTEDNAVAVIDCATDSVVGRIRTGRGPVRMHLSTLHHKLYVLNHTAESVTIVDLDNHGVIRTIPVETPPEAGCYSAAVDKYYCGSGRQVTVIDGQADTVVRRLTVSGGAYSMVAVDSHRVVMVGGHGGPDEDDTVFVFDAVSDTLVRALPTYDCPTGMCWSPLTDLVYVTAMYSNRLTVVEGNGSRVLNDFRVGEGPYVLLPVAKHDRV